MRTTMSNTQKIEVVTSVGRRRKKTLEPTNSGSSRAALPAFGGAGAEVVGAG
jgi:hypothetical protein